MKTFEQLYSQAIDGTLDEADRAAFEAAMAQRGINPSEIARERAFSQLLIREARLPTLHNADFFSSSVMERIRREAARDGAQAVSRSRGFQWSRLPAWARLAWGGAASLAMAVALTLALRPHDHAGSQRLTTRILSLHEFAAGMSATAISSPVSHYAVVWTDGIEYIPAETRIQ